MNTREAMYSALYDRVKLTAGLVTKDRILRHWNDVKPADQPALFLASGNETPTPRLGLPTKWFLTAKVYLYVRVEKPAVPATVLHTMIDALELSLKPDAITGKQNLGGMCHHCHLAGIEHDEGLLGQQAVAICTIIIEAV